MAEIKGTFETFVKSERDRLAQEREQELTNKRKAEDRLNPIAREFEAIEAYERVKRGKGERKPRATGTRGRRGGKRQEVLDLIRQYPEGLVARQVAERLGVFDEKQQSQINAALHNLKKQGHLQQEGRGGPYVAVA
jgi:Adenosine deaminase z-alpha domain